MEYIGIQKKNGGVAVLVLDSDAVDGKGSAILEPGFHPVGVHVVAAGICTACAERGD